MPILLVEIDSYKGPAWDKDPERIKDPARKKLVPIVPIKQEVITPTAEYSRTMTPVVNGTAITIHSSQGMTLEKVVLNVGQKEWARSLFYVAISRVTDIKGVIFNDEFSTERLHPHKKIKDVLEEEQRLKKKEVIAK